MTKTRLAALLLFALLLPALHAVSRPAFGQATVTARTVVLTRGRKGAEGYKQATVRYPVVSGLASSAAQVRANQALGLKAVFGKSLEEMRKEFLEDRWLDSVDYEVTLNRGGLLSVTFTVQGTGAYPWGSQRWVVADLKTGRRLRARDLFRPEALGEVRAEAERARKAAADRAVKGADAEYRGDLREQLRGAGFTQEKLNDFSLSPKGVTFHYDHGFPHVIKALEPEGEYLFPYAALKPYLRPGGPLAALVR